MIVLDASAAVEILIRSPKGDLVRSRIRGETLCAPSLIDVEVANAFRRARLRMSITPERGADALIDFTRMLIVRFPHVPLLMRTWPLTHNLTCADAMYVALAERLDAPVVTTDRKLASSSGHRAQIDLIEALD